MEYGWSVEESSWNKLEIFCDQHELNWKKKQFDRIHSDEIPPNPGVYTICVTPPEDLPLGKDLYTPIYIGKAEVSLQRRFNEHLSYTNPELRKARNIYVKGENALVFQFTELNKFYVPTLESILIECFGPTVNKVRGIATDDIFEE